MLKETKRGAFEKLTGQEFADRVGGQWVTGAGGVAVIELPAGGQWKLLICGGECGWDGTDRLAPVGESLGVAFEFGGVDAPLESCGIYWEELATVSQVVGFAPIVRDYMGITCPDSSAASFPFYGDGFAEQLRQILAEVKKLPPVEKFAETLTGSIVSFMIDYPEETETVREFSDLSDSCDHNDFLMDEWRRYGQPEGREYDPAGYARWALEFAAIDLVNETLARRVTVSG